MARKHRIKGFWNAYAQKCRKASNKNQKRHFMPFLATNPKTMLLNKYIA
jgi:hypothetical protein